MAEGAGRDDTGQPVTGWSPDQAAVRRLSETIYGTLVLMSVLTAVSEDKTDPREVTLSVAGSAFALFLTRWFSEVLADTVVFGKLPRRAERRRIIRDAMPLLAVAIVPVPLLVLAIAHIISLDLAVNVSLLIGTVSLAVWGFFRARRAGAGFFGTVFIMVGTLSIGLILVTLKAIVH
ncbi:MAG TPA: hypothetical protein VFG87_01690 [Amycolatopsis sp.]|jgi:hypothetical protein|nr:hypothetical protein [Amycolatopsis sp.]